MAAEFDGNIRPLRDLESVVAGVLALVEKAEAKDGRVSCRLLRRVLRGEDL